MFSPLSLQTTKRMGKEALSSLLFKIYGRQALQTLTPQGECIIEAVGAIPRMSTEGMPSGLVAKSFQQN